MNRKIILTGIVLGCVILASCATQPVPPTYGDDLPGFFHGLWHGLIVFPSLVGSLFIDIRIYAFPNSGFGYDCGFWLGALVFGGGCAAEARR